MTLEKFKAVCFFDLDGTLLDAQSTITPEVATAMEQLKANNVLPVIATGRTEIEIKEIMKAAKIESNIVMNGAFIRVNGEVIHSDLMEVDLITRFTAAIHEAGDQVSYYNEAQIWSSGCNDEMTAAYQFIHSETPPIDPDAYKERPVNMLLVLGKGNDEFYQERFPELQFYRNSPYSIDTVKKPTSKGTAVGILKEKLQLEKTPTYGFGDGPNDIALLSACDVKIAMGNAKDELKAIADFVTKKNTEGGIAHALKHFQLI